MRPFFYGRTMTKKSFDQRKREAFQEVIVQPPARVKAVRRKKGKEAARKMQIAIALDKARRGKK